MCSFKVKYGTSILMPICQSTNHKEIDNPNEDKSFGLATNHKGKS